VDRQLNQARYLSRARITSKIDHVTNRQELRDSCKAFSGGSEVQGSFLWLRASFLSSFSNSERFLSSSRALESVLSSLDSGSGSVASCQGSQGFWFVRLPAEVATGFIRR
jgi:hypothetical protein